MNQLTKIPCLTIQFKNPLKGYEIPAFRGAVISKVPRELTLFHNHLQGSFRFSYPLIQYKTIGGKAAIFCLGEGTREISNFFADTDHLLRIGEREEIFTVENVRASQWILQTWNDIFHYSIRNWLPLNRTNYAAFSALDGIVERTRLLENILTGNLLSMSKGLGHFFQDPVSCTITHIGEPKLLAHKGVRMQSFDIECKTNVYLPDFLGLGKGASMGFGAIKHIRTIPKRNNNDDDK